jgi:hypothetical protein
MEISVKTDYHAAADALSSRIRGLNRAARLGVQDAMSIAQRAIGDSLRLTTHPFGTPTPSAPGTPPSLVTGNMLRSVDEYGPYYDSESSVTGVVGVAAVQARIQELGGVIENGFGQGIRIELPARPYVAPAIEAAMPDMREAFISRARDAVEGA